MTAGNDFCGSVPSTLAGVVRHLVGDPNGAQLLHKVQDFRRACPLQSPQKHRRNTLSRAALAGMAHHGQLCQSSYETATHVSQTDTRLTVSLAFTIGGRHVRTMHYIAGSSVV